MKVFISYATEDALTEARVARRVLGDAGHKAWMYEHDSTLGVSTWREIAVNLIDSDAVFYICTPSSNASKGQERESGIALNHHVRILVVRLDDASVPVELTSDNYATWARSRFSEECEAFAHDLPRLLKNSRTFGPSRGIHNYADKILERSRYIQKLNASRSRLDTKRVSECIQEIRRSYRNATISGRVANISEAPIDQASAFQVIDLWERISLQDFNDPGFYWGAYFSSAGQALALTEEEYLEETIRRNVNNSTVVVSRSNPQFGPLTDQFRVAVRKGLGPDTMLAPNELFSPFNQFYQGQVDWSVSPEELLIDATRVRMFWCVGAQSDCFIFFPSRAGVWKVIPDLSTGDAISIAIGESSRYPNEVEVVLQTVVRYQVTDSNAYGVLPLCD